ncbi:hypothetical protein BZM26_38290 [Paraburkholderia strydomiana]|nr:hypothetical protein BZM26_38290 [Paraburkholderia strydomiana]
MAASCTPSAQLALRQVTVGGEALPGDSLARWREGPLADIRLDNLYGPTETTVAALYRRTGADDARQVTVPIGHPYPGRTARVFDAFGDEAPVGGLGELCIGGPTVARGYPGRAALTAERFVPDRTGSRGRASIAAATCAGCARTARWSSSGGWTSR